MKVKSREITYRQVIEQVFFEDESELIIKTGWPEDQFFDTDIDIEWAIGQAPKWATNLTKDEILKMAESEDQD